ncbi:molybdopterin molybdotransferase MoeA [Oceanospirillum sediminis]|uniref:Molybdopterin molybdenumtransferase n=1 Tax=Oceanospirillum sediminis TaxID=2760088 RepID=A0A839IRV8_9GAMM|nr:gephyrin-like molybdotransferase Glp [Oceanospirillum sediminis]MBB1487404.1 molybdopterin molybdotransferase MoeA [Oceanospirillum sediminis]
MAHKVNDPCAHPGLMPVDEAIRIICSAIKPVSVITLPLTEAMGYVLAESVVADINVPPADNSAMDGYALAFSDLKRAPLPVSQRITAGSSPSPLEPGTCARIFTGAEIPAGASIVVMQEKVSETPEGNIIFPTETLTEGENIRLSGQDINKGDTLLEAGLRLDAPALGLIASIGQPEVRVFRKPVITLLSTGDELAEPGQQLRPGQIFNSNRYMLQALFSNLGCEVIDGGIIADTLDTTKKALATAAEQSDMIITSGGVSVGEEDHVKPAVEHLGQLNLWRMAMKPGKPLAFGSIRTDSSAKTCWFTGLPGNPVSALLTALIVVRPALAALQGRGHITPELRYAESTFNFNTGIRREYLRVQYEKNAEGSGSGNSIYRFQNQNSGVLTSCHWADALAVVDSNQQIKAGDQVPCLDLKALMEAP